MKAIEQRAVAALSGITVGHYYVAGKGNVPADAWGLQRAREFYGMLTLEPSRVLTCEEAGDLWYLVWKYRRQIHDDEVLTRADEIVNGALSLFPARGVDVRGSNQGA